VITNEVAEQLEFLDRHRARCAQCQREFLTAVPLRRKYCGDACRTAASRERAQGRKAGRVEEALSALQARGREHLEPS